MLKKWTVFFLCCFSLEVQAHEKWLLSKNEIAIINSQPIPHVFSHAGLFNITTLSIALLIIILWIYFSKSAELSKNALHTRVAWSAFILRLTTGGMLLLASTGLLPDFNVAALSPTLFTLIHAKSSGIYVGDG